MSSSICADNGLPSIRYVPPIIYAEIVLCFDWDFSVESLNSIIGIQATETKRQAETRINPITHSRNPGYWSYQTEKFSSFDCEPLLILLDTLFSTHASSFIQVLQQYKPCDLFVRIWVLVQNEDDFPAVRLSPHILSMLSSLNATVDIIVENDYVAED